MQFYAELFLILVLLFAKNYIYDMMSSACHQLEKPRSIVNDKWFPFQNVYNF